MSKQVTIDEMLRKSAHHDNLRACAGIKVRTWMVLFVGSMLFWCVVLALVGFVGGCAPSHNNYLAAQFAEFNSGVQDRLEDCLADPNACKPAFVIFAAELETWTEILADPNLWK